MNDKEYVAQQYAQMITARARDGTDVLFWIY
jgi:hypothetical protein